MQLINPDCFALKAERQFALYRYLRRHNKVVVLGAFGNDWQWVECGLNRRLFRYGDFNVGDRLRTNAYTQQVVNEWLHSKKGELSRYIANDCDAIVTCLYEYQLAYHDDYPQKTRFIPLPIVPKAIDPATLERTAPYPVRFFLGIKRILMEFRGTDIFYDALQRIKADYPDKCEVTVVEDLPFAEYEKRMNGQDFILDQAYSYTPAMNAPRGDEQGCRLHRRRRARELRDYRRDRAAAHHQHPARQGACLPGTLRHHRPSRADRPAKERKYSVYRAPPRLRQSCRPVRRTVSKIAVRRWPITSADANRLTASDTASPSKPVRSIVCRMASASACTSSTGTIVHPPSMRRFRGTHVVAIAGMPVLIASSSDNGCTSLRLASTTASD